jgi:hypothetical protein
LIQPCTYNFIARPYKHYQWDEIRSYGQTAKVIFEGVTASAVMQSLRNWNKKMHPYIELKVKVRAQTFLIVEAVQPDVDSPQD